MVILTSQTTCNGCGATVEFKTTSSIVAVCPYCSTVVSKNPDDIANQGIKSNLLPDYSKIKVGSMGTLKSHTFTVLGRVQIKYKYGFWNEWYILFSNGTTGWLSDILDEFLITVENSEENTNFLKENFNATVSPGNSFPSFDRIKIDKKYTINQQVLKSVDITTSKITGIEGEIGFDYLSKQSMKVVDLKNENFFSTIDYSLSDIKPIIYFGKSFKLDDIQLSNTRTTEEINEANKSKQGKMSSFNCPGCGSSNPKINGQTFQVFCKNCGSQLDVSTDTVEIIHKNENNNDITTTLKCGMIGILNNQKYMVLGVIVKEEVGEGAFWVEYLLLNEKRGFTWLIEDESTNKWFINETLSQNLPESNNTIKFENKDYKLKYTEPYVGKVVSVWGSFNWEINVGDLVSINDYESGSKTISKEIMHLENHSEVSFSINNPIPIKSIYSAFKLDLNDMPTTSSTSSMSLLDFESLPTFYKFLFGFSLFIQVSISDFFWFIIFLFFIFYIGVQFLYKVENEIDSSFKIPYRICVFIATTIMVIALAKVSNLVSNSSSNYSSGGGFGSSSYSGGSHK